MEAGQNLEAVPHLGWANAVPDPPATGGFNVRGSALKFEWQCNYMVSPELEIFSKPLAYVVF
jgi:hypothetical protein